MAAAEPLDILTREPEALFSSDDEDGVRGELRYLPVVSRAGRGRGLDARGHL